MNNVQRGSFINLVAERFAMHSRVVIQASVKTKTKNCSLSPTPKGERRRAEKGKAENNTACPVFLRSEERKWKSKAITAQTEARKNQVCTSENM